MKLARKLTAFLVLGVCLVFAVFGYVQLRSELSIFDRDVRRAHRLTGQTLRDSVEYVWRTEGASAALALVSSNARSREGLTVRWVPGPPVAGSKFEQFETEQAELVTRIPVRVSGQLRGTLELSESLAPRAQYLREALVGVTLAMIGLTLVCGLIAAIIGAYLVGRPVDRLILAARRIGRGELDERLTVAGPLVNGDELAELARELNAMCDRLAEARDRVQQETAARIAALEQLRHAERLSTIGQLSSAIAHEIGTPLNVVAGHASLIRKSSSGPGKESAEVIAEQCRRITRMVQQLLNYARRREPKKTRVDIRDVLLGSVDLVRPFADKRGVTIASELGGELPVTVDAGQLQQVIINLLLNAIHASPTGSRVELTVSEEPRVSGQTVVIGVRDFGPGISEPVKARLFEPFFTTKTDGEGTGLGLSIAKDIVEEHQGTISVWTEQDRGTRFEVGLPRK